VAKAHAVVRISATSGPVCSSRRQAHSPNTNNKSAQKAVNLHALHFAEHFGLLLTVQSIEQNGEFHTKHLGILNMSCSAV
jgi:hypothetical protein